MAKRSEVFQEESLAGLYANHPHLLLFQKEDWRDYLLLLAHIYDLIEDDQTRVPFEVVRSLAIKFFSQKQYASIETKISQFFNMTIGELRVLKDSHDHIGQRYLETTRCGKELLQLIEGLLSQRTRFSGTGAETLLAALNQLIVTREQMTAEQAIDHHRAKIKAYQEDIQKIRSKGVEYAELLPIPHSSEALFSQAEEAALHILSSVEDVKSAIENQRQTMAESYFESSMSAGRKLNAVMDFYEVLHKSSEYMSYMQAKNLLSYLEGLSARFQYKNVDHLVHQIQAKELISKEVIQRSHLKGFSLQFQSSDNSIQEKIKSQLKLLQSQVSYALTQDIHGIQKTLQSTLTLFMANKESILSAFGEIPVQIEIPSDFDHGEVGLFHFHLPLNIEATPFDSNELDIAEQKALCEALLAAEEATLQNVIDKFLAALLKDRTVKLVEYPLTMGLAEYYVLSEIELFDSRVRKDFDKNADLSVEGKFGHFVLIDSPSYVFYLPEVQ